MQDDMHKTKGDLTHTVDDIVRFFDESKKWDKSKTILTYIFEFFSQDKKWEKSKTILTYIFDFFSQDKKWEKSKTILNVIGGLFYQDKKNVLPPKNLKRRFNKLSKECQNAILSYSQSECIWHESGGFNSYKHGLLTLAQVHNRKLHKYNFTAYTLNVNDPGKSIVSYLQHKLKNQEYGFDVQYVIHDAHWETGLIRVTNTGDIKVLHIDSHAAQYSSPEKFYGILDNIYNNFPNAKIYTSSAKTQSDTLSCSVHALNTAVHLKKADANLPEKENHEKYKDIFDFIDDNITRKCENCDRYNEVDLPLYLQRCKESSKVKAIFDSKGPRRANTLITKKQITPYQSVKKDLYVSTIQNINTTDTKLANNRIRRKHYKMLAANIEFMLHRFEQGFTPTDLFNELNLFKEKALEKFMHDKQKRCIYNNEEELIKYIFSLNNDITSTLNNNSNLNTSPIKPDHHVDNNNIQITNPNIQR